MTSRIRLLLMMAAIVAVVSSCASSPPTSERFATSPVAEHKTNALIFGDSYTKGIGAAKSSDGYAYQIGPSLGWNVTVDGVGGTGYLSPGESNSGTYVKRLGVSNYADTFDIVIVEGGTNDQKYPIKTVSAAIDDTLTAFRHRFAHARIIVLGMLSWKASVSSGKAAVNLALRTAAEANGCLFIDPIAEGWFTPADEATMINPADDHPNANGYATMAQKLADDLKRMEE